MAIIIGSDEAGKRLKEVIKSYLLDNKLHISEVKAHKETLDYIVTNEFLTNTNIVKMDEIRLDIRELMRFIEKVVMDFSITWYVSKDDVMYAATHYRNGEIPNESAIKSTADFTSFKEAQERAIPKFKYYNMMIEELRKTLEEEIRPLLNN